MTSSLSLKPEYCFSFQNTSLLFSCRDPVRTPQHCPQTFFFVFFWQCSQIIFMCVKTFFPAVSSCSLGSMNARLINLALSVSWYCNDSGMCRRGERSTCGVLPMASRLSKNCSPSSMQLLDAKRGGKYLRSGLSMRSPLPLTMENKLSVQSWLRWQVFQVVDAVELFPKLQQASDRNLPTSHAWQFLWTSKHRGFQAQQGLVKKFFVTRDVLKCRMFKFLVKLLLLNVLHSLSMHSTNTAVLFVAGFKAPKVTIVETPTATLCDTPGSWIKPSDSQSRNLCFNTNGAVTGGLMNMQWTTGWPHARLRLEP